MLLRDGNSRLVAAFFESGIVIKANYRPYCGHIIIDVEAQVPHSYDGLTQGLFGVLDRDVNNDLRLRDGTILSIDSIREDELYNRFDQSCM